MLSSGGWLRSLSLALLPSLLVVFYSPLMQDLFSYRAFTVAAAVAVGDLTFPVIFWRSKIVQYLTR